MNRHIIIALVLASSALLFAQGGYTVRNETLDTQTLHSETHPLHYPAFMSDVRATGMGQVQTAGPGIADYGVLRADAGKDLMDRKAFNRKFNIIFAV